MRIGIVGSRGFCNWEKFSAELSETPLKEIMEQVTSLITGDARGTDAMVIRYGKENNIPVSSLVANWCLHGKKAGVLRNMDIVSESDLIIAFWDGVSKGTKSTIDLTIKDKKKVIIVSV